jgi:hypothetical protein
MEVVETLATLLEQLNVVEARKARVVAALTAKVAELSRQIAAQLPQLGLTAASFDAEGCVRPEVSGPALATSDSEVACAKPKIP